MHCKCGVHRHNYALCTAGTSGLRSRTAAERCMMPLPIEEKRLYFFHRYMYVLNQNYSGQSGVQQIYVSPALFQQKLYLVTFSIQS